MNKLILAGALVAAAGCSPKFTDAQAENVVRKCVERKTCKGVKANLVGLNIVFHNEESWTLNGNIVFSGPRTRGIEDGIREFCSAAFISEVTLEEHNLTRNSNDPIVSVNIKSMPSNDNTRPEKSGCYYYLASGNSAEK